VDDRARVGDAIASAGRRLRERGLISATEGNLSVRLVAGRLLISPRGRRKDELVAEDLLEIDIATGSPVEITPRPSSDLGIHLAIYRARPEVAAIAHAHLPVSLALTLAGEVPDPAVLPETALLLPRLPFVPFGVPGSSELAGRITRALSVEPEATAVLLERHGAVAIGASIEQAVDRLELVDLLCRVWRDARALAPGRPFHAPVAPA
jgi:L-fuculose-phosphate aldolase